MGDEVKTPAEPSAPAPVGQQVVVTPAPAAASNPAQEMFPRSYVEELRAENARYRTTAKEHKEKFDEAAKEIERLRPLEGQIKSMQVDSALSEVISKAGVDAKLTKALLRDEIGALDPASDKFKESLTSLVEKAAKENPSLKATVVTGSSGEKRAGSDITHPNTQTPLANDQWSREQLAAARRAGDHEGIAKALKEGKLKSILGGS